MASFRNKVINVKEQITNFILNSKRKLLKFRIFFPFKSKKEITVTLFLIIYHFYLFEKKNSKL